MIKRITALTAVILILYCIFGFSVITAQVTEINSALMRDKPSEFQATGFIYSQTTEEVPPFHKLQNQIIFNFIDSTNTHGQFIAQYNSDSIYGPSVHTFDLYLTYDKGALSEGYPFITGTFTYVWERNNEIKNYSGTVSGTLVETDIELMNFESEYSYTNAIALVLDVDQNMWNWTIYLEIPGEEAYYTGTVVPNNNSINSNSEKIPKPSSPANIAAGVGISTIGITLVNAFTRTTVLGAVQSFSPNAVNTVISTSSQATASNNSIDGGIISSVKNFFKNLFANLRDMLTDEGRSFASGKVADFLEDSDFDNSGDNT